MFIGVFDWVFFDVCYCMIYWDVVSVIFLVVDFYFEMYKFNIDVFDKFWLGEVMVDVCEL